MIVATSSLIVVEILLPGQQVLSCNTVTHVQRVLVLNVGRKCSHREVNLCCESLAILTLKITALFPSVNIFCIRIHCWFSLSFKKITCIDKGTVSK